MSEAAAQEVQINPTYTIPSFTLDAAKLGPQCSLNEEATALRNDGPKGPARRGCWKFPGTTGTLQLTAADRLYWEVLVHLSDLRQDTVRPWHCELGVASVEDLQGADLQTPVAAVNKCSTTVHVQFQARQPWTLSTPGGPHDSYLAFDRVVCEQNLSAWGFFFDGPRSRVTLIPQICNEVHDTYPVTMGQGPIVPFVNVLTKEAIGKDIEVQIRTGHDLKLSSSRKLLLSSL